MRKNPEIPANVFFDEPDETLERPVAGPVRSLGRGGEEDKVQVTVYLSPAVAKRLEALRFHLLSDFDIKVPKSAIAEYALAHLSDDLTAMAEYFQRAER